MEEKKFLDVEDVAGYMGISVSKAYKIIRQMNDELKAAGYLTVAGKVSAKYFSEKIYGLNAG